MNKQNGWYLRKSYAHFDKPLPFAAASRFVSQPANIARHSFFPFLSFEITARRIGKQPKKRPIKYPAHVDGYIFAFYSSLLSQRYEDQLKEENLTDVVLAYRAGLGNNISFAKNAFDEVVERSPCVAIGFDISGFFDCIDHVGLKREWANLLGNSDLPDDHYAVFKAITKYSFVDVEQCYKRLRYSRKIRETSKPICSASTFRRVVKGRGTNLESLVERNLKDCGIPQGSQISAILSNIYMLPFDKKMRHKAEEIGGYYRRYSDDILWICPVEDKDGIHKFVSDEIKRIGPMLKIKPEKTISAQFEKMSDGSVSLRKGDKPFQYLGFLFDGTKVYLVCPPIYRQKIFYDASTGDQYSFSTSSGVL